MSAHTPGPWVAVQKLLDPQEWRIDTGPDHTIGHSGWTSMCEIKVYGCDDFPEQGARVAAANARLIKSSPNLLKALTWLYGLNKEQPRDMAEQMPLALGAARTAIEEATGEELP